MRCFSRVPRALLSRLTRTFSTSMSDAAMSGSRTSALHTATATAWGPCARAPQNQFVRFALRASHTCGCVSCMRQTCWTPAAVPNAVWSSERSAACETLPSESPARGGATCRGRMTRARSTRRAVLRHRRGPHHRCVEKSTRLPSEREALVRTCKPGFFLLPLRSLFRNVPLCSIASNTVRMPSSSPPCSPHTVSAHLPKAATSIPEPRETQDWFLKCLAGWSIPSSRCGLETETLTLATALLAELGRREQRQPCRHTRRVAATAVLQ